MIQISVGYEKEISEILKFSQMLREIAAPHNLQNYFEIYPADHERHYIDIEPIVWRYFKFHKIK